MFVDTFRILAIVWLSVSLIGGPTLVVCRAGSDHISLEVAHTGACEEVADACDTDDAGVAEPSEPDCQDQALLDATLRVERQTTELSVPPPLPLIYAWAFPALPSLSSARLRPSDNARMPPWHLTPLASVVLHI